MEMLKDHANLLPILIQLLLFQLLIGNLCTFEKYLTLFRLFQQIQATQKRTLSTAAGANNADYLALVDHLIDPAEHRELAKAFLQALYPNHFFLVINHWPAASSPPVSPGRTTLLSTADIILLRSSVPVS